MVDVIRGTPQPSLPVQEKEPAPPAMPVDALARLASIASEVETASDLLQTTTRRLSDARKATTIATNPESLAKANAEIARLTAKQKQQSENHRQLATLLSNLEVWLGRLRPHQKFTVAKMPAVRPAPGTTLVDLVESIRSEIIQTRHLLHQTENATAPTADLKAMAAQHVARLVELGRPKISVNGSGLTIAYRKNDDWSEVSKDERLLGAVAWVVGPDAFLARINEAIDQTPLPNSLSGPAKAERLQELAEELARLERREESAIREAGLRGITIMRRPNASPAAVLGVSPI